ncbi:hypothetical protein HYPSUDRAFT_1096103, partial [Hypholoma sublateritium FD-334 SS-4]
WLLDQVTVTEDNLKALIRVLVERADNENDYILPGYTHLQRGQPIRWAHLLLSYAFSFRSDLERLRQLVPRIAVLPLGSGALAGNSFGVDRGPARAHRGTGELAHRNAREDADHELALERLFHPCLDEDRVHELRLAAASRGQRRRQDMGVSGAESHQRITTSAACTANSNSRASTASSMMPQKKNPDSLELLRGKSRRLFGNTAGFMMTLKGLPSTYKFKDLQEDKETLFDTADNLTSRLSIAEGVVATLTLNGEKMRPALTMDVLTTDLTDYYLIPFHEAHHISRHSRPGRGAPVPDQRAYCVRRLQVAARGLHGGHLRGVRLRGERRGPAGDWRDEPRGGGEADRGAAR